VGESLRVQDSDFGPDAIPALEWFAGGARFRNLPAFVVTKNGARGYSFTEELGIEAGALEGHPNQFIGYLSELGVPLSTPWKAWDNQKKQWSEKTLQAVLDDAKSQTGINPTPGYLLEHTWTLWALANYGAWNDQWKNERGETWNMEKLIQFEVSQGITDDTSCGGHHRIYAIYRALKQYLTQNGKLPSSGVYRNAQNFISTHLNRAEKWQNQDGSFSANNYLSASMATDWDSRLAADGHTLEVLVGILPDARLKEEWLLRAVYIVASDLTETKSHILRSPGSSWGATFHALHALRQFMERTR
jgi:hypothetical protein